MRKRINAGAYERKGRPMTKYMSVHKTTEINKSKNAQELTKSTTAHAANKYKRSTHSGQERNAAGGCLHKKCLEGNVGSDLLL